ncbi:MAG: DUF3800 domain-containing protein [Candidatus Thiothrix putei]|uniref:DUF3800 domain-containing protein n=1 Tax=Candidatus Thiothrix putei TaxID=3080811 RepID=A0AA95HHQ6_9GAMM|nr:MAG: DUF3800 domain-containing protein [Candidatus Thiothrix putei]
MDFEVYCDENHPELFASQKPTAQFLMIGSLWLPASLREEIKERIWQLREKHNAWGEIKWRKISYAKLEFYKEIIDLYESYGEQLRFRCIAIDHKDFNDRLHKQDNELGFYKFYYQVLHHWILDFNSYRVFCDVKTNRDLKRLETLKACLRNANLNSQIQDVQALPSKQVVLIQLADLLLGMASARMNHTLRQGSAKEALVLYLEQKLNRPLAATYRSEHKFNTFKINLQGGW